LCLHGDGDHVEPGFVGRAGEGVKGLEGVEVGEIGGGCGEVPEVDTRVGRDRGNAEVAADGLERDGDGWRENLGITGES
jgi:hypothetical protein